MVQFVFPSATGGPLCDDNFHSRVFCKPIELADVPRFQFRDIRHMFASLLLSQGESVHYLTEQMSHPSIQATVDVYGDLVRGSNRNAVNRLDDVDDMRLKVVSAEGV